MSKFKKIIGSLDFLIFGARLAFTKLRQAFVKAQFFYHFNPELQTRDKTDVLGYAIGRIFSQLTSDDLGWWHLVILAKYRYKTYNAKLLAIIKTF